MQNVRVCVECASKNPDQLDTVAPDPAAVVAATKKDDLVPAAAAVKDVTDGLETFKLKPKSKTGVQLFKNLVKQRT